MFDKISEKLSDNSLIKLNLNVNFFEKAFNIINKNKNSLKIVTINIQNKKEGDDIFIIKTLSNIINLKYLNINAHFQIINENNIKYLFLKEVETLNIPLIISKSIFNFNSFFEKIPKLNIITFNKIIFIEKDEERKSNVNSMNGLTLKSELVKNIKKIIFCSSPKNSSFFILAFLKLFINTKIKFNINEINISKCHFPEDIGYNNILAIISKFINITSLSLNNISFEKEEQKINFNILKNLNKLEYLYLKDFNYKNINMNIGEFLLLLSLNYKYINELGLSCKEVDSKMINLIAPKIKNFRYLTKLNFFNGYDNSNTISENNNEQKFLITFLSKNSVLSILQTCNLERYCMIDLRNINIKIDINFVNRYIAKYCNKNNEYFCYQRLFNNTFYPERSQLIYSYEHNNYCIECKEIYNDKAFDEDYFDNDNDSAHSESYYYDIENYF